MKHLLKSPSHGEDTCYHDPLIFLNFISSSPLIKPLVAKNVFSSCSLDRENFLRRSLDPQKCLSLFPIFVCLFHLLFKVEKIAFELTLLLEMRSCCTSLAAVSVISTVSAAFATVLTSLVW